MIYGGRVVRVEENSYQVSIDADNAGVSIRAVNTLDETLTSEIAVSTSPNLIVFTVNNINGLVNEFIATDDDGFRVFPIGLQTEEGKEENLRESAWEETEGDDIYLSVVGSKIEVRRIPREDRSSKYPDPTLGGNVPGCAALFLYSTYSDDPKYMVYLNPAQDVSRPDGPITGDYMELAMKAVAVVESINGTDLYAWRDSSSEVVGSMNSEDTILALDYGTDFVAVLTGVFGGTGTVVYMSRSDSLFVEQLGGEGMQATSKPERYLLADVSDSSSIRHLSPAVPASDDGKYLIVPVGVIVEGWRPAKYSSYLREEVGGLL